MGLNKQMLLSRLFLLFYWVSFWIPRSSRGKTALSFGKTALGFGKTALGFGETILWSGLMALWLSLMVISSLHSSSRGLTAGSRIKTSCNLDGKKLSIILLLLTTLFFSTAQSMPLWRKPADIGYWFYQDPIKLAATSISKKDCNDPKTWRSSCGFIDPTHLKTIDNQTRFAFEQQQYHALLRDLSVNPNDLTTVLHWQRFNHWVIGQAMAAAYSTQFLVTQHPELDANVSHPFSQFGIALLKKIQLKKHQQWFEMLAQHSLLVLFSRSDCPYCRAEAPLVQHLAQKTHIQLWNASLDGQQLPGFDHVLHAPETLMPARILKVNTVPALFLYLPAEHKSHGTWIRLATGITPEDVIEQRVIRFMKHYRGALIEGVKSGVKIVNK